MGGKQEGKGRKIFRKEGKQTPKEVFLHQCFIIFIHSIYKKKFKQMGNNIKANIISSYSIKIRCYS